MDVSPSLSADARQDAEHDAKPGQGIHHPNFGVLQKEKLDPLKVECVLRHRDDYRDRDDPQDAMFADMVAFFRRRFDAGSKGT